MFAQAPQLGLMDPSAHESARVTEAGRPASAVRDVRPTAAREDIAPDDWAEKGYKADIVSNWNHVYMKPGYNPL